MKAGINFLSHLLLDELIVREKSDDDPLIVVSVISPVYKYVKPDYQVPDKNRYRSFKSYGESKFYLLLIRECLINKYPGKNLRFIGFDPGIFSSGIYRTQKKWFQVLYQIAAPFMRSPVKVATNLAEILRQENIVDRAVYTRWNRFRNPDIKNDRVGEFLKECSNIIRSYL